MRVEAEETRESECVREREGERVIMCETRLKRQARASCEGQKSECVCESGGWRDR